MTELADWLGREMARNGFSGIGLAEAAGVGQATVSGILRRGHVPRVRTLQKISGALGVPDTDALEAAGYLKRGDKFPGAEDAGRDGLVWQLVEEFERLPAEWRRDALEQVRWIGRLAKRERARASGAVVIGGDGA